VLHLRQYDDDGDDDNNMQQQARTLRVPVSGSVARNVS
jgi:hypothetical protein